MKWTLKTGRTRTHDNWPCTQREVQYSTAAARAVGKEHGQEAKQRAVRTGISEATPRKGLHLIEDPGNF